MTVELRVGMSLYWATLTNDRDGYTVAWKQNGRAYSAWSRGTKNDALHEARLIARQNEAAQRVFAPSEGS